MLWGAVYTAFCKKPWITLQKKKYKKPSIINSMQNKHPFICKIYETGFYIHMKISRNCTKPHQKHNLPRFGRVRTALLCSQGEPAPATPQWGDFSPRSGAQHFMSSIWKEMGSPEGQECPGKLGSCQSSALERNYPLCPALLQLCTHQRQTDPNPSKK